MRIFYTADGWQNHFPPALTEMGHQVIEFQYDWQDTYQKLDPSQPSHADWIAESRPKVTRELVRQIKEAHARQPVDLFFSYFYDGIVFPEAIEEIKSLGIKTVNWYCNGSYQLHLVRTLSPHYDWCLAPEKFRLKDYKAMNARPVYCQEAANPEFYKPYPFSPEYDVSFVGQAYGDRPDYIKFLRSSGIDVRVWGMNWSHYLLSSLPRQLWRHYALGAGPRPTTVLPAKILGDPLTDTEMVQMYSRSKINLGFSSCGETHRGGERILQVRLRDFEVPMSGGFYMVEYMEELEEFFDIGKEIVCYTDAHDLADKIKHYLRHDGERERIRAAGHARCLRDHSWRTRLDKAFTEMGLADAGQSGCR